VMTVSLSDASFKAENSPKHFYWWAPPGPAGCLQHPKLPSRIKGTRRVKVKGREGRGREGKGGEGKG